MSIESSQTTFAEISKFGIPFVFFCFFFRPLLRSTSWCENWAGLCQDGTSWSSHVRFMDETMWRVAASKPLGAQQRSKKVESWLDDFGWFLVSFFEEPKVSGIKETHFFLGGWIVRFLWYCWWKKSCTSWYSKYPMIDMVLYIPGGAGFLPSTVLLWKTHMSPEKWWLEDDVPLRNGPLLRWSFVNFRCD